VVVRGVERRRVHGAGAVRENGRRARAAAAAQHRALLARGGGRPAPLRVSQGVDRRRPVADRHRAGAVGQAVARVHVHAVVRGDRARRHAAARGAGRAGAVDDGVAGRDRDGRRAVVADVDALVVRRDVVGGGRDVAGLSVGPGSNQSEHGARGCRRRARRVGVRRLQHRRARRVVQRGRTAAVGEAIRGRVADPAVLPDRPHGDGAGRQRVTGGATAVAHGPVRDGEHGRRVVADLDGFRMAGVVGRVVGVAVRGGVSVAPRARGAVAERA